MRSLIVTLFYLLFAVATAHRDKSPRSTTEVATPKLTLDLNSDMWIYPPGWGLGGCPSSSYCAHPHDEEDKTKKVKPVKRGTCTCSFSSNCVPIPPISCVLWTLTLLVMTASPPKKQRETPEKTPGWFGVRSDDQHPHWKDVEEVMDGLE